MVPRLLQAFIITSPIRGVDLAITLRLAGAEDEPFFKRQTFYSGLVTEQNTTIRSSYQAIKAIEKITTLLGEKHVEKTPSLAKIGTDPGLCQGRQARQILRILTVMVQEENRVFQIDFQLIPQLNSQFDRVRVQVGA